MRTADYSVIGGVWKYFSISICSAYKFSLPQSFKPIMSLRSSCPFGLSEYWVCSGQVLKSSLMMRFCLIRSSKERVNIVFVIPLTSRFNWLKRAGCFWEIIQKICSFHFPDRLSMTLVKPQFQFSFVCINFLSMVVTKKWLLFFFIWIYYNKTILKIQKGE